MKQLSRNFVLVEQFQGGNQPLRIFHVEGICSGPIRGSRSVRIGSDQQTKDGRAFLLYATADLSSSSGLPTRHAVDNPATLEAGGGR
jgi:hypothetical protein